MTGALWTVRAVRVVIGGARVSASAAATLPGAIAADVWDLVNAMRETLDAFERAEEEAEGYWRDGIGAATEVPGMEEAA